MKHLAVLLAFAAAIVWVHTHTDEIPFVFGVIGIAGTLVGSFFPRHFVLSGLLLGLAPIAAEFLVRFGAIPAPWPPTHLASMPLIALVCQCPALLGATLGWFLRRQMNPAQP